MKIFSRILIVATPSIFIWLWIAYILFHLTCAWFYLIFGIMQFVNKAETVLKWVLNRPYQTKVSEWLVEMSGSSSTTTKNRRLLGPCAFNFVYIFIVDWNFFVKYCSSDTIFTRGILTSLYLKSKTSAYVQLGAYSFIHTIYRFHDMVSVGNLH